MASRRLCLAILAIIAIFAPARTSEAGSISFLENFIGLNFGCPTRFVNSPCSSPEFLYNTRLISSGSLSFSNSFAGTGGNGTLTFIAGADSSYGSLHSSAYASFDLASAGSRFAVAGSTFGEYLTVNAPGLDGLSGSLTLQYTIDGSIAASNANAFAFVGIEAGTDPGNPNVYGEQFVPFTSSFDGNVFLTIPIVYGHEFFLKTALGAVAGTATLCFACEYGIAIDTRTGAGFGSVQFGNTLNLTGLTPTFNDEIRGDAQFTSASGTQYSLNGVVPEPGSLVLLGTGLLLGTRQWRRRKAD